MEEKTITCGQKLKKYFKELPKRYFITAFSGMAQGLFVTLIAGTILAMIAGWLGKNYFADTLLFVANMAKFFMGAGIGVGIAHALGKNKLIIFSAAVAGMIGSFAEFFMPNVSAPATGVGAMLVAENVAIPFAHIASKFVAGIPGNPIAAYVVTMLTIEIVDLYTGKTKLDILIVPLGMLLLSFAGVFVAYPFILLVNQLGNLIAISTQVAPFLMGIIISVIMGIVLTMPTSSAAIWTALALPILGSLTSSEIMALGVDSKEYNIALAGGAATVGCACHMVGFAIASFRENKWGGLIAQGLGTSMLQIPNIMKKPVIMTPMIISSAILGPISTCVFKLKCGASGGGMGTSGLVGVFDMFKYSGYSFTSILGVVLLMIILPAILNLAISEFMRKKNWIKFGDMTLPD